MNTRLEGQQPKGNYQILEGSVRFKTPVMLCFEKFDVYMTLPLAQILALRPALFFHSLELGLNVNPNIIQIISLEHAGNFKNFLSKSDFGLFKSCQNREALG